MNYTESKYKLDIYWQCATLSTYLLGLDDLVTFKDCVMQYPRGPLGGANSKFF